MSIVSIPHSDVQLLARVVQTLDSAIHRINHYPANSVINFRNTPIQPKTGSCMKARPKGYRSRESHKHGEFK